MRALFPSELATRWLAQLALLALTGCIDPYLPDVADSTTNYLTVDGFINGNGRSTFLLSRSTSLTATTPAVEKGAKVYIVDNTGQRYALPEIAAGSYRSDSLALAPNRQYQLTILTAGNVRYASDLVPLKATPPIDALGFRHDGTQVDVLLSAHDASQQTRYYRWSFVETWEFHSAFSSRIEYYPHPGVGQSPLDIRTTPIYTCWRTERPSTIRQTSTAPLSQDALTDLPLYSIPLRAERVKIRYSVLVSQYAETADEFAYYELLRKNTEAVGTVNDPLPVQLTGNVHRLDQASEPVLGFVGAHTVQYRRIFISRADLPPRNDWDYDTPYRTCTSGEELLADSRVKFPHTLIFRDPSNVPIDYLGNDSGYTGSSRECVDCRLRGSNVKPDFW